MNRAKQDLLKYINLNTEGNSLIINDLLYRCKLSWICVDLLKKIDKKAYIISSAIMIKQKCRNEILLKEIKKIEEKTIVNNIKVIYLKGITLAYDLYEPPDTRIFSDLDLLIDYNDAEKSLKILTEMGYNIKKENLNPKEIKNVIKSRNHLELYKKINGELIVLELHGSIFNPPGIFSVCTKEYMKEINRVKFDEIYINTLNTENYFIYLCLHFVKHLPLDYFDKLIMQTRFSFNMQNIHDIALFIDKYESSISWQKIYNSACNMLICGYIYFVSKLVNEVYGNRIPLDFINELFIHKDKTYIDVKNKNERYWAAGRFLWLFDLCFDKLCKLTPFDLMTANIKKTINLKDYVGKPKSNPLFNYKENKFKLAYDLPNNQTIYGEIKYNLKGINLIIIFENKPCVFYEGKNNLWSKDSIDLMIVGEYNIKALTIGPVKKGEEILVGIFDHNKGKYFEKQNIDNIHYKFSQCDNQYIFDINILWQYFNIEDINENMLIPYNIAINIGNENSNEKKCQFKLFGNSNFWWDFRGCGILKLVANNSLFQN